MGLNDNPYAGRVHIGFFGMQNTGKSSLANAVAGGNLPAVSDAKGAAEAVRKAAELPLGPAVIIDTPGLGGAAGDKRAETARQALSQTDIAVLVADAARGLTIEDRNLIAQLRSRELPYVIAYNKADLLAEEHAAREGNELYVSAVTGENVNALREMLGVYARELESPRRIVSDLLSPGDTVVLVIPNDSSLPKGRLSLPQQQTMRDILDANAVFAACQSAELPQLLSTLKTPPCLVIADSQALAAAAQSVPEHIPLTSFSILFARYKGNLKRLVRGAAKLRALRTGDRVLIAEGCPRHLACSDVGTAKLPGWIEQCCGAKPTFTFTSGGEFLQDLSPYALIIHCGGCMLGEREMRSRLARAALAGVPAVNYGVAIAQMNGILSRCLRPFPDAAELVDAP